MRLGEGTYAFIVSPPIPSNTLSCLVTKFSSRDIISKVFKPEEEISPKYQPFYRPIEGIQERLKPVLEILQRLDPNQERFFYPIFMEKEGLGYLPDELKKDGVKEERKGESYYVFRGGPSYDDIFRDFFLVFRNIVLGTTKDDESEEEKAHCIYTFLYPIAKKAEALTRELYKHQIYHGDLHSGNILLNDIPPSFQGWIQKTHQFIKNVKESPVYKTLKSILGRDCLLTYPVPKEHRSQLQELLEDLKIVDIQTVTPVLIDWDSAYVIKDGWEDYDTGDLFYTIFPLDSMVSKFWKDIESR